MAQVVVQAAVQAVVQAVAHAMAQDVVQTVVLVQAVAQAVVQAVVQRVVGPSFSRLWWEVVLRPRSLYGPLRRAYSRDAPPPHVLPPPVR